MRVIQGDFSPRDQPIEPDWSQVYSDVFDLATAHATWLEIVTEMREAGTLSPANGHAIRRLVDFRLIYEKAAREAVEHGAVVRAKKSGVPQYSPHWIVARQADEAMRAIEGELGISPLKRGRATKVQRRRAEARPSDKYLGGRK